jgi:hypothetical protein
MNDKQRAALDRAKREMAHALDLLSVPIGSVVQHTDGVSYATKEMVVRACSRAIDCLDTVLANETKKAP